LSPTLAIIGSVVMDILVETPRMPLGGDNIHVPRIQVMTGGKAANAAAAFVRLGGRSHLIGNLGADAFGPLALAALEAEGVDVAGIHVDAAAPTGAGVLLVEPHGHTAFLIAPGANQTLTPGQLESSLLPLLPHLDGLLFNFESPESCLLLAVDMARAQGIPIFVDAGPYRPYSPALWRHAAILTPNAPEAAAITGHAVEDEASALAAARTLLAHGPQAVVLKLGERGALLVTADGHAFIPAYPIQAVDTAGAGDAFTAGLVGAVLRGQTLAAAVRNANACGAVAASRFGTMVTMPTQAQVAELMSRG